MSRYLLPLSAAFGFLAVAFGAFGAHALKGRLDAEMLAVWQTGVQYQMAHSLAILLVLSPSDSLGRRWREVVAALFGAGILVFSGSLYLLALSGDRWLGAITPIGGVCFLSGWAVLIWGLSTASDEPRQS